MPRVSSTFAFAGSLDRLSIRVQLFQKGIQSLDFDRFGQENTNVIDEKPTKSRLDDVTFKWKQKVGQTQNSTRRIFTLHEDDEFPDYLQAFKPEETVEKVEDGKDYEYPINDFVVMRRKSTASRWPVVKKQFMFIFARLGSMDIEDSSAVELLARITVIDSNRITVEPPIDEDEIPLETRFGDFTVKIKIDDVEKGADDDEMGAVEENLGRSRRGRSSVSSIPESETFMAARDGLVESVVNVNIAKGIEFLFEDGLTIDYKLRLPAGVRLKTENATGRSPRFSAEAPGEPINFGYFLEFVFEAKSLDSSPLLMLRFMAVDYWGRQYIAGYGSTYVSLSPGRSASRVHLWRPISHNALYEMFVGQAIDIDYFESTQTSMERVGREGQPSGIVCVETNCIAQSRHFMARDILYQLKYGSKMADMGLRSDFYQRIIKVLMEFEEARSKLIMARALNKKRILRN